ncbi:hypothetical protein FMEXI_2496 [Fusarium mexicanum]|uniref:Uncharacterized protein n=1 Tax=Fusarium mexicanum TaxID=751941 RepID=A0A8H5JE12_9HYPO|nr:hypothetical protein FMEXI_2496 [Fusarium mexicanum]
MSLVIQLHLGQVDVEAEESVLVQNLSNLCGRISLMLMLRRLSGLINLAGTSSVVSKQSAGFNCGFRFFMRVFEGPRGHMPIYYFRVPFCIGKCVGKSLEIGYSFRTKGLLVFCVVEVTIAAAARNDGDVMSFVMTLQ